MRLAIVGTGLIGSSFALAARRRRLFDDVVGVDPNPRRAARAQTLGVVDMVAERVPADADAVLLAGPADTVAPWVAELAGHAGVVFDAASVKSAVIDAVRQALPAFPRRFVPCHPLAGSERSGPGAASGGLFDGAEVILTPVAETAPEALARVSGWWQAIGARTVTMDAATHDEVLAVTSHLPHLLAFAYLQQVEPGHLAHTAGAFRDFTRIGAADADMWAPILRLNGPALGAALDIMERALGEARALLDAGDDPTLKAFVRRAGANREGRSDG